MSVLPRTTAALAFTAVLLTLTVRAEAFCGFYVSGAEGKLVNNATMVAMMREGTLTVLSMQNNYQGPPDDFALIVPVPVVLQEENVKTLDRAVFDRVDRLAAPRLVEYWEQDPCGGLDKAKGDRRARPASRAAKPEAESAADDDGVIVEAQFTVGEYEIVILSASDSTGLDKWLRKNEYNIPAGAEPVLKPYVEGGSKFFVAKVNSEKVTFKDGQVMLSPLRFHYNSEDFSLPVRLGLLNAAGKQDLIVHILAKNKRYEVANYKNVTVPTNIDVDNGVRERFGEFYAALFDMTLEKNPAAVVTEYSWDAGSCDPCPVPALRPDELATLGADAIDGSTAPPSDREIAPRPGRRRRPISRNFVLTRLHVRYDKASMTEDLRFTEAGPIVGGREFNQGDSGLEKGAREGTVNNFQARYAIRHRWEGPVACAEPQFGRWGGPPAGKRGSSNPTAATDLAFAPRGKVQLAKLLVGDVPELDLKGAGVAPRPAKLPRGDDGGGDATLEPLGCGCEIVGPPNRVPWLLLLLLAAPLAARTGARSRNG